MSDLPETPPSSPASHEIGPGYILEATILNVDSQNHLAEVAMDNAEGAIPDVRVVSLYCHPFGGEGIFFLPEAGASCYLFIPSDEFDHARAGDAFKTGAADPDFYAGEGFNGGAPRPSCFGLLGH